jgi:hypothetical protein
MMDTDGYVAKEGAGRGRGFGAARCELTFCAVALVPGAMELMRTLGINPSVAESDAVLEGRVVGRRWRMSFQSPFNPFSVPRKADRWVPLRTRRASYRYVVGVERVAPLPTRCIQVDSADGTYLCGEHFVPTHNSTLLRQIAVCAAQGIHPLRFTAIEPVPTLIADLENPAAAIAETGGWLDSQARRSAGTNYDPGRCMVWSKPAGVDLRSLVGAAALEREIEAHRPRLVVLGPIYKTAIRGRGEDHESMAEGVQHVLDDLRTRYSFALLMEHHAPQGSGGQRDIRPYGSQRWLAWPEIGIGLQRRQGSSDLTLSRWRGDRLVSEWPSYVQRDRVWPWVGVWESGEDW